MNFEADIVLYDSQTLAALVLNQVSSGPLCTIRRNQPFFCQIYIDPETTQSEFIDNIFNVKS